MINQETHIKYLPRKIMHFHIPKTGGTTLYNALSRNFSPSKICPLRQDNLAMMPAEYNLKFDLISSHVHYDDFYQENGYYGITYLRDPLDRFLSAIRYFAKGEDTLEAVLLGGKVSSLTRAQPANFTVVFRYMANAISIFFDGRDRSRRYNDLAITPTDIEKAIINLGRLDFIGMVEDFDSSFNELMRQLEMPESKSPLPLDNVSLESGESIKIQRSELDAAVEILEPDYRIYMEILSQYNRRHGGFKYLLTSNNNSVVVRDGIELVVSDYGQAGIVLYGPYVRLPVGTYTARFYVAFASAEVEDRADINNIVEFEAVDYSGRLPRGRRVITIPVNGSRHSMEIEFDFDVQTITYGIEFRVISGEDVFLVVSNKVCVARHTSTILPLAAAEN